MKLFSILITMVFLQGCSVYMAFTQPPKVELSKFDHEGVHRDLVIGELGPPTHSITNQDGTKTDTYEFYEGSDTGWKIGRGLFHLGADIVSLALWEIVATPTEYALKGDKLTALATFDQQDRLQEFKMLTPPKPPPDNVEIDDY